MVKDKKKPSGASSAAKQDSRFASFETNPRYRLPSKGRVKTKIDKRFQRVFEDDDFTATAKLDRYGRKLKSDNKKKALRDIYEPEEPEVEEDTVVKRELEKADANYDPARGGGFSSSEDESEFEDDDEEDEEQDDSAEGSKSASVQRLRDEQGDIEVGDITKRFAVVNLDWDNIKSTDLMALFSSFAPQGGRVEKVSIYPSEFGKERMKREEIEGPPREIFKKTAQDDDEDEEDSDDDSGSNDDSEDEDEEIKKNMLQEGDDQDFDSNALRSYQLDRLRYYYAVVICSDLKTAEKIYTECDGSEYLASSNFMDLRFVPDDVTFDDQARDECDSVLSNYEPTEFVTDALQHSKVKLTWDVAPDETARRENIRKAFSGSRAELEENDFRAYLASDSDGEDGFDDEVVEPELPVAEDEPKLSKKELKAKKLREVLGLSSEPLTKSSAKIGPVGDMQVTFTPALMGEDKKKKEADVEETTVEKYIRKEKERKARKKEQALSKRNGGETEEQDEPAEPEEDLGFDDPFFTTDEPAKISKSAERKEERRRRREEKEATEAENAAQKAHLEKIMADNSKDQADHLDHFDMDEIARAEKKKSKKGKKGKNKVEDHGGLQEGFDMNVDDSRFKAVFESHEFAIDPSNPRFKSTPGMKKLLEEGRKKRKNKMDDYEAPPETNGKTKKQKIKSADDDISSLVESIRQKAQAKKR
ncbi:hypothetical protein NPX13_g6421 [Xylaria arbuscula]|uniref:NUC153 domain-containing protein n=1 Tax=Xylaria arbuscula TaxID=114810 RepID=A0A9W8TK51_9PEZI|nr:hypothetical protein NPX13_g6421 [Xylaria arbuscula]